MKRLIAILAVCLAAVTAGAVTLETGRIKVETGGEYPILKYDQNPAFSFEVRAWGKDGWWVRSSAVRGECYIFAAEVGEQVLDYPFDTYHWTSHDSGPNVDVFRFQFRWKHTFNTESGGTATLMHYGWISLVTNGAGEVCVLASQVADFHAEAVVGQGEPNSPVAPEDPVEVEWSYHVVKDSWVELDPLCIPETTAGAIEIPREQPANSPSPIRCGIRSTIAPQSSAWTSATTMRIAKLTECIGKYTFGKGEVFRFFKLDSWLGGV